MEAIENAAEVLQQDGPKAVEEPEIQADIPAEEAEESKPTATEGDQEETPEQKRKRLGGWQRKILKLEQESEFWRNEALRNRSAQEKPPVSTPEPPRAIPRPQPEQFLDQNGVIDWTKYQTAEAKWLDDQIEIKVQAREQKQRAERDIAQYQQRMQEARENLEDFEEAIANQPRYSELMAVQIIRSDVGPYMQYYFAHHPEEAARIGAMTDRDEAIAALGEIRGYIRALAAEDESGEDSEEVETAAPPKPRLPKPPNPVTKPAATATAPREDDDADTWMAKRRAQLAKQGRPITS